MADGDLGERIARLEQGMASLLAAANRRDGKLDGIASDVADIKQGQSACMATQTERWRSHDKEHSDNVKKSVAADGITGVVTIGVLYLLEVLGIRVK